MEAETSNASNDREERIKRVIKALLHASNCKDADCPRLSCYKMKRVMAHFRRCNKPKYECAICKQTIGLLIVHCKNCIGDDSCTMFKCRSVHDWLRRVRECQAAKSQLETFAVSVQQNVDLLQFDFDSLHIEE